MNEQYKILSAGDARTLTGGAGLGAYNSQAMQATSPRAKSSMDMTIDRLAAEISAAEMNFQSLGDKLNPVRSTGANICEDNKPSNGPNCELEQRILELAHRVSILSGGIGTVTAQVCL